MEPLIARTVLGHQVRHLLPWPTFLAGSSVNPGSTILRQMDVQERVRGRAPGSPPIRTRHPPLAAAKLASSAG
jgi:hypothetical protein